MLVTMMALRRETVDGETAKWMSMVSVVTSWGGLPRGLKQGRDGDFSSAHREDVHSRLTLASRVISFYVAEGGEGHVGGEGSPVQVEGPPI